MVAGIGGMGFGSPVAGLITQMMSGGGSSGGGRIGAPDVGALLANNPLVLALQSQMKSTEQSRSMAKTQQGYYNTISSALQQFGNIAQSLDSSLTFGAYQATTSDASVVNAAAGTGAQAGTQVITVQALALSQSDFSNAIASPTTAVLFGTGSVAVTVGVAAPVSFTVDNTTTLQSLANAINAGTADVQAGVVATSGGYSLQVTGKHTGSANAITYNETGTTLGLASNNSQPAQDAQYNMNGQSLISTTNTVSNAMPGLTLQLLNASTTPQVINVSVSAAKVSDQIQTLVGAFNNVVKSVHASTQADDPANLASDPTVLNLLNSLSEIVNVATSSASGTYSALPQIGILQNGDGTLSIDNVTLQQALTQDSASVLSLFQTSGSHAGIGSQLYDVANDYGAPTTGVFQRMGQVFNDRFSGPDLSVSQASTLQNLQKALAYQYSSLQTTLAGYQTQSMLLNQLAR